MKKRNEPKTRHPGQNRNRIIHIKNEEIERTPSKTKSDLTKRTQNAGDLSLPEGGLVPTEGAKRPCFISFLQNKANFDLSAGQGVEFLVADFFGNSEAGVQCSGEFRIKSIRYMMGRQEALGQCRSIGKAVTFDFLLHPLDNLFFCHNRLFLNNLSLTLLPDRPFILTLKPI
jgi:hypothetical protein